jgi:hypothetical protein
MVSVVVDAFSVQGLVQFSSDGQGICYGKVVLEEKNFKGFPVFFTFRKFLKQP